MNDPDDLDALVTELNAGVPRARTDGHTARLRAWLEQVVAQSASDLLLVAGAPPMLRIAGAVVPIGEGPLGGEEIADAVEPALPPHARRAYRETGIADASYRTPDLGRFRVNLHRERGRAAAAIRRLPAAVPRLASLGLPPSVEALSRLPRGLVLIGGPTGSGKTTTHRGARERNQSSRNAPHHHHRGSDRIRAPAPALPDRARRDRHRRAGFSDRAARRPAPGPRRHRRRRDARSRDHADRAGRRRDRTPGVFEPAHHRRGDDHRPDRRLVSARTAEHGPAGAGDGAGGGAGRRP